MSYFNIFFEDNFTQYKEFSVLLYNKFNDKKDILDNIQLIIKHLNQFHIKYFYDITEDIKDLINDKLIDKDLILTLSDYIKIFTLYEKLNNDFNNINIIINCIKENRSYLINPLIDVESSEENPLGNNLDNYLHTININISELLSYNENYNKYNSLFILKNTKTKICHNCRLEITSQKNNSRKNNIENDLYNNSLEKCNICICNKFTPKNLHYGKRNLLPSNKFTLIEYFKNQWINYHKMLPEISQHALFNKYKSQDVTDDEIYRKIGYEMWNVIIHNKNIEVYRNIYDLHYVEYNKYLNTFKS